MNSDPAEITESGVSAAVDAALAAISAATDSAALKTVRTEHTGESSPLAKFNALMRSVPGDQKAAAGKLVGAARGRVNQALTAQESEILEAEATAQLAAEAVDVTAAASTWTAGARHPLPLLQERIADVFVGMGWEVAEGPELESEWFNFDALNFDEDHPARAMQDTFFRYNCAPCSAANCRSTSWRPAVSTAPTNSMPRTPRSSPRSRASPSTRV